MNFYCLYHLCLHSLWYFVMAAQADSLGFSGASLLRDNMNWQLRHPKALQVGAPDQAENLAIELYSGRCGWVKMRQSVTALRRAAAAGHSLVCSCFSVLLGGYNQPLQKLDLHLHSQINGVFSSS